MPGANLYALNRGEVAPLALARVDQEPLRLAAEIQLNWQPTKLGPMTLRPGLGHVGEILGSQPCQILEAVYETLDSALIELTPDIARFWVDDALVARVKSGVTIQAFPSWTSFNPPFGTLLKSSTLTFSNVTKKQVAHATGLITVPPPLDGTEFGLRIDIQFGDVLVAIGTTSGGEDIMAAARLDEGVHSIAIEAKKSSYFVRIASDAMATRKVSSVTIEPTGVLTLPTPYIATDIGLIRYGRSLDVHYLFVRRTDPRKIERRSKRSFGITRFKPQRGPFSFEEGDKSVSMTLDTGRLNGDVGVTASKRIFRKTDAGRLIRIFHNYQTIQDFLTANETFTDPIRITGVKKLTPDGQERHPDPSQVQGRTFTVTLQGTWSGKVTLQKTNDPDGLADWAEDRTFTSNTAVNIQDPFDNVIAYYRLGFAGTDYGSGTANCSLSCKIGGGHGTGMIAKVNSGSRVIVHTQKPFSRYNAASVNWRMSEWGVTGPGPPDQFAGFGPFIPPVIIGNFPAAVALHESRLMVGGRARIWASETDAFEVFDFDKFGDASMISRTIGAGPNQNINWMLSVSRLLIGTDYGVLSVRSNALDEPLTPTNFLIRPVSDAGTAPVRAVSVDEAAIYIPRSNRRIHAATLKPGRIEYTPDDLSALNPAIGLEGFKDLAVQRHLDTHIRAIRNDGQSVNLLYDEQEQARAFWRVATAPGDRIENVAVLPGQDEDRVYVVVARVIQGETKRYLEKFALLSECQGGAISKLLDSHVVYDGVPAAIINVPHLKGRQVAVWADGAEVGFNRSAAATVQTYTVDAVTGDVTLPAAVVKAVVGVPYSATFVSTKLAYAAFDNQPVNKKKRVDSVGFVLHNTHMQGVRYGHWHNDPAESTLRDLPLISRGASVPNGKIHVAYDQESIPFPGKWDTDSRIQIAGQAPRPATVMGVTLDITTTN